MNLKAPLAAALLLAAPFVVSSVYAQGREGREGHEARPGGGGGGERRAMPVVVARPAPPHFMPHPAGGHPHGPMVRPHPVRVLAPRVVTYGGHQWHHWEHPEFARPAYYWEWNAIHSVTCIAEDSYGDQYPVTESTFAGFGLANMTTIEDDALDRCNAESGGDASCYLATCSHF